MDIMSGTLFPQLPFFVYTSWNIVYQMYGTPNRDFLRMRHMAVGHTIWAQNANILSSSGSVQTRAVTGVGFSVVNHM